jgi:nucleoside-diphosphate-sugar epimerase
MSDLHVVVGAGPIGSGIATRLADHGRRVRVVTRSGSGPDRPGIERVRADASDASALAAQTAGADAIYNAVNPPYHRWPQEWPPIAAALLAAAEASGAVLVTVSNLYGYGPVDAAMTEDLPLTAPGSKGRVRAQMWADALAAHRAGRVRVTEVRGSDYVGAGAESHLGERVVPRVLAGKGVRVVGSADAPHTWTYTGDVARLSVTVATDPRAWGRAWHVPSSATRTQREAIDDLARVAGVAPVPVGTLPRPMLAAAGLFSPTVRELKETLYQFDRPFVLDDSAAREAFGLEPTPWDDVLAEVVASYRAPAKSAAA